MGDDEIGWSYDGDPWAGMVDEDGFPVEPPEPAEQVAAEAVAAGETMPRLFTLPEEFWGSRELFKRIRQQARADATAPDAVLGAVLARASAMVPPEMKFDSGKEGVCNLFVNVVTDSGIGKTEAMRSAQRVMTAPGWLLDGDGRTDMERFRDGVALGSGEGMAEVYMGSKDVDTGEFYRSGPDKGQPRTKTVRAQVRSHAFLFLDEGEALTKMLERKGATVGMNLRTAWTGMTLGAANARDETTRFVPDGSYSMGLLIGWQPKTALALLSDGHGGTPQRFLWVSGVDPEMPVDPDERPEPFPAPLSDPDGRPVRGHVHFPAEIKRALRAAIRRKHVEREQVAELDSHEPLMRCKLAALLCLLDGRRMVDRDDWRLASMLWEVSCSVRDRLVAFGEAQRRAAADAERARHAELAEAAEEARYEVNERVLAYARAIGKAAAESFDPIKRSEARRGVKSNLRRSWDAGLLHAEKMGWIELLDDGARFGPGTSVPR